jgi:hypothetical protein
MELLKDSTGSHILMGTAGYAVSYEANRYGDGLLTYALLQGMKGAALAEGNRVEVVKLFEYATRQVEQLASGIGGVQRPLVSSPGGQSFPIGLLNDEDKRAIPLANPKPQLLRVECRDELDGDPRVLTARVRSLLRVASQPATRRQGGPEPPLVYIDDVVDDVPSAMSPRVRYVGKGEKLEVTIRLYRDNQMVSVDTLTLEADPATAAREIADAIIKAVIKVGPQ